MIFRFAFFVALAFAFASCTSTNFQSWEGRNSVVEGHGGTRKVVDGMDVWTHADPPRRFQVLGIIEDERPGGRMRILTGSGDSPSAKPTTKAVSSASKAQFVNVSRLICVRSYHFGVALWRAKGTGFCR
jgi:hypothetical protein